MKVTTLVIALFFISKVLSQAVTFDTSVNASLANQANFNYRGTLAGAWSLGIFSGAWFGTLGATVGSGNAKADAIYAACYVGTFTPPLAWIAYWEAQADFNVGKNNNVDWANVNVTGSEGFLGYALLELTELDANGGSVKTTKLKDLKWEVDTAPGSFSTDGSSGLYWITFKGTTFLPSTLEIKLTFATSSQVGYLSEDYLNAFVSPKSLEIFVKISNYPYADAANQLKLTSAVATADATLDATGHLSLGEGDGKTYFNMSSKARVDGTLTNVDISGFKEVNVDTALGQVDLATQLKVKYGGSAKVFLVDTVFPSGAKVVMLDPTLGSGPEPEFKQNDPLGNSGSLLVASTVMALLAIVQLFF